MDNKLPIKKISKSDIANLRPVEELELFSLNLEKILPNTYEGATAVLCANDKMFAQSLTAADGTHLTFAKSGLAQHSHIKTIHQIYLGTMKDIGSQLERVIWESQHGDVLYCRLQWCDRKHRRIYAICDVGDALILAVLAKAPMYIVKKVLDNLDSCEDWVYEDDIFDDGLDY